MNFLGTISAIRVRVLEGAGVAVLPRYFVTEDLRRRRLVALFARTPLPSDWFRLVWPAGHRHEAALKELTVELAKLRLR